MDSIGLMCGRILKACKEKRTDETEEQSRFKGGGSYIDSVFTLNQLYKKRSAHEKILHLTFIDL
jgi:hypothetical protein